MAKQEKKGTLMKSMCGVIPISYANAIRKRESFFDKCLDEFNLFADGKIKTDEGREKLRGLVTMAKIVTDKQAADNGTMHMLIKVGTAAYGGAMDKEQVTNMLDASVGGER